MLLSLTAIVHADEVSFRRDIAPLLRDNCLACHDAKNAEGGYRVDTFEELVKSGDSGETPIAVAKADTKPGGEILGELFRRLVTDDDSERMPAEAKALSAEQIKLVESWMKQGAKFDGKHASTLITDLIPDATYPDPPTNYPAPVAIMALAFSENGNQVFAGGYHEVTLWDRATGKLVRRFPNVGQRVYRISVDSAQNRLLVACGEPGRQGDVRSIDLTTGEVKGVIARSNGVVFDFAIRPGTSEIAVANAEREIDLVDLKSMQVQQTLTTHADWVVSVAWSHDGKRLISASRDRSVKVYDVELGHQVVSYQGHGEPTRGAAFIDEDKQAVSVGDDASLHRWNVSNGKKVATVSLGAPATGLLVVDKLAIVPCRHGKVVLIDLGSNKILSSIGGHESWATSIDFEPSKKLVAVGSINGQVQVLEAQTNKTAASWLAKP